MKVVALAGGVGGAKLADGLARALPSGQLTVVVNTGDDFDHFGLHISPDLDTVCYTLAGLANPDTGWGLADESWEALGAIKRLGGPDWFHLGDRDLGTHLERTRRLSAGQPLSRISADFCHAWGVPVPVLPMSDQPVATSVITREYGQLPFQEYFVHHACQPQVTGFRFDGVERASPAPGVEEALKRADCVILCPSNPWVSIAPILNVPGIRELVQTRTVVAVSPIVGGRAIKGPAAKMYTELGIQPSALAVAKHYGSLLTGLVIDGVDAAQSDEIDRCGIISYATNTVMVTPDDRLRLAQEVLIFAERLVGGQTSYESLGDRPS
jgi:LPPG:FO 2-phospho-L-lactate transferase